MPYNSKYTGATAEAVLNSIPGKVGEAPKDSANYARNNGAWVKLNKSLLATVVGPRQMIAQNGSGEQAYTFSFDQPAASITLKSLSISGPGVSLKSGYSKSGFTVVATDIVGDITAIVTAVFTFGSVDYTIDAPIIVSYQKVVVPNGHDYVDLGLPSGTLWATCNVGADSPGLPGLYFQWGGVDGYANGSSYYFGSSNNPGASISGDLPESHDAARANMGGSWRMPTSAEFAELFDNTSRLWQMYDNKYGGYQLYSKADSSKSIFIPASGMYQNRSLVSSNTTGYYWVSSMYNSSLGGNVMFSQTSLYTNSGDYKYWGMTVRAVI